MTLTRQLLETFKNAGTLVPAENFVRLKAAVSEIDAMLEDDGDFFGYGVVDLTWDVPTQNAAILVTVNVESKGGDGKYDMEDRRTLPLESSHDEIVAAARSMVATLRRLEVEVIV